MKNSREGLRKERNDLYSIDLKSSLAVFLNDAALNLSEKWKRPPQSVFEAAREIGHVWAPNP